MGTAHKPNAKARKKRRTGSMRAWRLIVAFAVVMAVGLTTVVATTGFDGTGLANAAVARAKSFLQIMQQRSPGTRTKALLVKTKHKRIVVHERALPKVRMAVPTVPPAFTWIDQPALVDLVAPPVTQLPASLEALAIPPLSPGSSPPGNPLPPLPRIIVPPVNPSTVPLVPPTAVPEPGTWLTMLLGFGFLGWQLRRRRVERKAFP